MTGQAGNDGTKYVQIMVPFKYGTSSVIFGELLKCQ